MKLYIDRAMEVLILPVASVCSGPMIFNNVAMVNANDKIITMIRFDLFCHLMIYPV